MSDAGVNIHVDCSFHYLVIWFTFVYSSYDVPSCVKNVSAAQDPDTAEPAHQRPAHTQAALNMYTVFWRSQFQYHINILTAWESSWKTQSRCCIFLKTLCFFLWDLLIGSSVLKAAVCWNISCECSKYTGTVLYAVNTQSRTGAQQSFVLWFKGWGQNKKAVLKCLFHRRHFFDLS